MLLELKRFSSESSEDQSLLQEVLESAPKYWSFVSNRSVEKNVAQETFLALPEGKTFNDKFVFGVYVKDECIGCIDLIRG